MILPFCLVLVFRFAAVLSTRLASAVGKILGQRVGLWHHRLRIFSDFAVREASKIPKNFVTILCPCPRRAKGVEAEVSFYPTYATFSRSPASRFCRARRNRRHRASKTSAANALANRSVVERCHETGSPARAPAPFGGENWLDGEFAGRSVRSGPRGSQRKRCYSMPRAACFMPSFNFLMSSGDNCGRSILIVSLLNWAVSGNGGR